MSEKRILIVDDEASILSVLKRSLEKLGSEYVVSVAADARSALEQLGRASFDLVVTDYRMPGMDGLQLMEAVRSMQPKARSILMTAYGSDEVEAEARRLQAYGYLMKPLEIDDFRRVVRTALSEVAIAQLGIVMFSDDTYQKIVLSLKRLRMEVGARCVVLADIEGHSIARDGDLKDFPLETRLPLLSGCLAALDAAGRALDASENTLNLLYRESTNTNLYLINIGAQLLLVILIDRGAYSTKMGTVWYAAQQVASKLLLNVVQKEYANPQGLFGQGLVSTVEGELDSLIAPAGNAQKAGSKG